MIENKRKSRITRIVSFGLALIAVLSLLVVFCNPNGKFYQFLGDIGIVHKRCDTSQGGFAFYNVGNGDASCVYTNQAVGLIDTGTELMAGSLIEHIKELKTSTLDFVVLSHPHNDHAGGYLHLLKEFTIKRLFVHDCFITDFSNVSLYQEILEQSLQAGTEICYVTHGMTVKIGGISMTFYDAMRGVDENQRSLVVDVEIGDKNCLYTGDIGFPIEHQLLRMGHSLKSDILKVGHHGSVDASSTEFLKAVLPEYAVVSVGQNNYGHPSRETAKRIEVAGAKLYRTDICHKILFSVENQELSVSVH